MADISKITLPNGNTYNIKDSVARASIEALAGGEAITFGGVTTTELTDGGTEKPVVDGTTKDCVKGQIYFKGTQEFLWDGDKWIELGNLNGLGTLAYKNSVTYDKTTSASYTSTNSTKIINLNGTNSTVNITVTDNTNGNYTPAGSISQPTFSNGSIAGSGKITPSGTVSQPSFTGTGVRLVTSSIPVPTSATLVGTEATIDITGTATGTISKPSFTGTKVTGLTVSSATSGTTTYTPEGTVAAPTISIETAGTTNNTLKPVTAKSMVSALATAAPGTTAPANAITYYDVSNETLSFYQIGATKENSVTLGSAVTVKTGDATYTASAPAFTGTGKRLVVQDYTPAGNVSQPTFSNGIVSGTTTYTPEGSINLTNSNKTATVSATTGTATYTPGGNISQPTFTGTESTVTVTGTATGTISQPTFTGTKVQFAGSATAAGSITLPTISLGHVATEATYT